MRKPISYLLFTLLIFILVFVYVNDQDNSENIYIDPKLPRCMENWSEYTAPVNRTAEIEWSHNSQSIYFLPIAYSYKSTIIIISSNDKVRTVDLSASGISRVYDIELKESGLKNSAMIASYDNGLYYIEDFDRFLSYSIPWRKRKLQNLILSNQHFLATAKLNPNMDQTSYLDRGSIVLIDNFEPFEKTFAFLSGHDESINGYDISHFTNNIIWADRSNIYFREPKGETIRIAIGENCLIDPRWSPESNKFSYIALLNNGNTNLYIGDTNKLVSPDLSLTSNHSIESQVTWSPDGNKLAYISKSGEFPNINRSVEVINVNSLAKTVIFDNTNKAIPELRWSPNGEYVAFFESTVDHYHVYAINVNSKKTFFELTLERNH